MFLSFSSFLRSLSLCTCLVTLIAHINIGASLLGKVAETEEEAEEEDENEKAFSPTRATTRGKEKHSSTTSSLATDALLSDIVGEEDEKLDELVMSLATKTKLKADEAVASSSSSPLVKTKQLEKQVEEKAEETKDKEETEGIAARAAAEKRGRIDRGEADQFEGEEGGDDEDVTLSLSEVEEMEEEIEELEAVEAEAVHEEVKWLQNEIEDEGEVKDATEPYSKSSRVPLFVDEEEVDEDDNSEKSDSVRKTLGELWAESEPSARSMETSDGRKDRPPQMPVRNSVGALIVPYATLSTVSSDPLPSFVKVSEREVGCTCCKLLPFLLIVDDPSLLPLFLRICAVLRSPFLLSLFFSLSLSPFIWFSFGISLSTSLIIVLLLHSDISRMKSSSIFSRCREKLLRSFLSGKRKQRREERISFEYTLIILSFFSTSLVSWSPFYFLLVSVLQEIFNDTFTDGL